MWTVTISGNMGHDPRFARETYYAGDMVSTRRPKLVESEGTLVALVFNSIWTIYMVWCVFVELICINVDLLTY